MSKSLEEVEQAVATSSSTTTKIAEMPKTPRVASSTSTPTEAAAATTAAAARRNSGSHHQKMAVGTATGAGAASVPGTAAAMSIGTKPTLIERKPMRFLIMDAPRQGNLHIYIKEMRKHQVTDIVRVCEPTYAGGELGNAGIQLHDMEYKDGTSPSKELIDRWLQLVYSTFFQGGSTPPPPPRAGSPNGQSGSDSSSGQCIAVHCVAGLGRAPVMVAIALIEFANMDPVEAVSFIRGRRRGAINEKQLLYLEGYKKQFKRPGSVAASSCCVIL